MPRKCWTGGCELWFPAPKLLIRLDPKLSRMRQLQSRWPSCGVSRNGQDSKVHAPEVLRRWRGMEPGFSWIRKLCLLGTVPGLCCRLAHHRQIGIVQRQDSAGVERDPANSRSVVHLEKKHIFLPSP